MNTPESTSKNPQEKHPKDNHFVNQFRNTITNKLVGLGITASAKLLLIALYEIANQQFWAQYIRITNDYLAQQLECDKDTIIKNRDQLVKIGAIRYMAMGKRGGVYEMLPNYEVTFIPLKKVERKKKYVEYPCVYHKQISFLELDQPKNSTPTEEKPFNNADNEPNNSPNQPNKTVEGPINSSNQPRKTENEPKNSQHNYIKDLKTNIKKDEDNNSLNDLSVNKNIESDFDAINGAQIEIGDIAKDLALEPTKLQGFCSSLVQTVIDQVNQSLTQFLVSELATPKGVSENEVMQDITEENEHAEDKKIENDEKKAFRRALVENYEQTFGGTVNPNDYEQFMAYYEQDQLEPALVFEAFKLTRSAGINRPKYTLGILKNWFLDGVTTLENYNKKDKQYPTKKVPVKPQQDAKYNQFYEYFGKSEQQQESKYQQFTDYYQYA